MKSLNLYIKNRIRVNINSVILLDILGKTNLILILNLHEILLSLRIINIEHKLLKLA